MNSRASIAYRTLGRDYLTTYSNNFHSPLLFITAQLCLRLSGKTMNDASIAILPSLKHCSRPCNSWYFFYFDRTYSYPAQLWGRWDSSKTRSASVSLPSLTHILLSHSQCSPTISPSLSPTLSVRSFHLCRHLCPFWTSFQNKSSPYFSLPLWPTNACFTSPFPQPALLNSFPTVSPTLSPTYAGTLFPTNVRPFCYIISYDTSLWHLTSFRIIKLFSPT